MNAKIFGNADGQNVKRPIFFSFRRFQFICLLVIVVILSVVSVGLRIIFQKLILNEAEHDAVHISTAIRDSEISRFFWRDRTQKQFFSIPPQRLSELDNHMRSFLVPFDIVKIKVYDIETRIVYSTDSTIIGEEDSNNAKLLTALEGTPTSKYESKDEVCDLEDEKRTNVEIVETYIPMYNPEGKVIGSFEIYMDVTRNLAMANSVLIYAVIILSIIVFGIFVLFMFLTPRAVKTISSTELIEINKQFQQEIDDRRQAETEKLTAQIKYSNLLRLMPKNFGSSKHDE
ncbi:MAG: hypothetical protein ACYSU4_14300 [Planctomycetota bacterium]|jgi:hypothetical protein